MEAAVAAVRAEAADNRMRLDARLAAAEAERAEASAASERLRAHNALIDAERQRLAALSTQAIAEIATLRVMSAKAEQERLALAEANSTLTVARDQAAAKAERERRRANELDWEAKRASLHARHVEARVAALLDSGSWKATAPLRAAGMLARNVSAASRAMTKRAARAILSGGLGMLRTSPALKRALHDVAVKSPLGEPFLRFARARPPAVPAPPSPARPMLLSSQLEDRSSQAAKRRVLYYYVDHTIGCPVNTGMQRVVRGLAAGLLAQGSPLVFVKWSRTSKRLVLINRAELHHLGEWSGPRTDAGAYPDDDSEIAAPAHQPRDDAWLIVPEVAYINAHQDEPTLDVLMAARQAKLKTAFVFYDAIPLRRPEFASSAAKHETYMRALLLADFVAPISKWSAVDLASYLTHHELADLSQGPAIEPLLLPGESSVVTGCSNSAKAEKLILCVGTIEQRKNQGALLEAFENFSAGSSGAGWRLELVGNLHPNMAEQVNAAAARNAQIRYRGNLSDADLAGLYDACAFTVFPSVEEGFGLPIVESLSHGRPCICADFGAMAEVAAGGGCVMVDVRDPEAIAAAIETLATDARARAGLAAEAAARPVTTWTDYAQAFASQLTAIDSPLSRIGRIFYCIHSTAAVPFNSGIQRVVRGLAGALLEQGYQLIPVKWSKDEGTLVLANKKDLSHVSKWNGPAPDDWRLIDEISAFEPEDWFLSAELLIDPADADSVSIEAWAHTAGLRTAWIFYDTIPWKMRGSYDSRFSDLHSSYMRGLRTANLILPISSYSATEYARFLDETDTRMPNRNIVIQATPLPGEFKERPRTRAPKEENRSPVRRILCVCTVESRKNHLALIEAFQQAQKLTELQLELWLVGREAPEPDLIRKVESFVAADMNIYWERSADDSRLAELYELCDFTVYPSLEEGFGLPILESLWAARPCICSNQGAMLEVGVGGGCVLVDTRDANQIRDAILALAENYEIVARLAQEATGRCFKSWSAYAEEVSYLLARERPVQRLRYPLSLIPEGSFAGAMPNLSVRPRLSICITTYNRADWLRVCLRTLARLIPDQRSDIEVLVVDNASSDKTPQVFEPYVGRSDFRFIRNPSNVGMLGNLAVTADAARGEYVWIIGDDDLPAPGSIEAILDAIKKNDGAALIYLNYSYTREDDPGKVVDLDEYFASATPISPPSADFAAPIAALSMMSENLFTAIYCLVFRRDHSLRAYTLDTSGRPFSTMLTCIPSTYHVLHHMMHERGVWLGEPQIVVNMNVSWLKYASIWILERIPEAFCVAEQMGADPAEVDRRRAEHLRNVSHWFQEILRDDPESNRTYFDPAHLHSRFRHLPEYLAMAPELRRIYSAAHETNPTAFPKSPEVVFQ
ncbi:MAG: glycosyltransferase [Parvularculaceae bacterium]